MKALHSLMAIALSTSSAFAMVEINSVTPELNERSGSYSIAYSISAPCGDGEVLATAVHPKKPDERFQSSRKADLRENNANSKRGGKCTWENSFRLKSEPFQTIGGEFIVRLAITMAKEDTVTKDVKVSIQPMTSSVSNDSRAEQRAPAPTQPSTGQYPTRQQPSQAPVTQTPPAQQQNPYGRTPVEQRRPVDERQRQDQRPDYSRDRQPRNSSQYSAAQVRIWKTQIREIMTIGFAANEILIGIQQKNIQLYREFSSNAWLKFPVPNTEIETWMESKFITLNRIWRNAGYNGALAGANVSQNADFLNTLKYRDSVNPVLILQQIKELAYELTINSRGIIEIVQNYHRTELNESSDRVIVKDLLDTAAEFRRTYSQIYDNPSPNARRTVPYRTDNDLIADAWLTIFVQRNRTNHPPAQSFSEFRHNKADSIISVLTRSKIDPNAESIEQQRRQQEQQQAAARQRQQQEQERARQDAIRRQQQSQHSRSTQQTPQAHVAVQAQPVAATVPSATGIRTEFRLGDVSVTATKNSYTLQDNARWVVRVTNSTNSNAAVKIYWRSNDQNLEAAELITEAKQTRAHSVVPNGDFFQNMRYDQPFEVQLIIENVSSGETKVLNHMVIKKIDRNTLLKFLGSSDGIDYLPFVLTAMIKDEFNNEAISGKSDHAYDQGTSLLDFLVKNKSKINREILSRMDEKILKSDSDYSWYWFFTSHTVWSLHSDYEGLVSDLLN